MSDGLVSGGRGGGDCPTMEKTKQAGGGVDVENIFWGHPFGESFSHAVAVHFNLLWRYFQVDGRDFTILPIGKRPGGEKI